MAGTGDADDREAAAESEEDGPAALDGSDNTGKDEAGKSDAEGSQASTPEPGGPDPGEPNGSQAEAGEAEPGGAEASGSETAAGKADTGKGAGKADTGKGAGKVDAGKGAGKVDADKKVSGDGADDTESTAFAPLAQWASRAGKRPDSEAGTPPESQAPTDPWPKPIQGLIPPLGQPYGDQDLLRYETQVEPPPDGVQAPPKRRSGLVAAVSIVVVALLLGAAGVFAAVNLGSNDKRNEAAASFPATAATTSPAASSAASPSTSPAATPATSPSASPSTSASTEAEAGTETDAPDPVGPVAQGILPTQIFETEQICDGVAYWPMLPKRSATKAPHPIMVYDENLASEGDKRGPRSMFDAYFMRGDSMEAAWAPENDLKATGDTVQIVACLDRTSTGAKVRSCQVKDPNQRTLTLYHASWRLHVYETATGKKLLDSKLVAKDTSCPDPSQTGFDNLPGRKLYMGIDDSTLIAALQKFVER